MFSKEQIVYIENNFTGGHYAIRDDIDINELKKKKYKLRLKKDVKDIK